jgi:cytoskeletal protein CcmA (bactofilin family)
MGLFGRDDRSQTERDEVAAQTRARRGPTGEPAVAGGSVIARSTRIEGTILGSEEIRIEGQVNGTVDITSRLVVAGGGRVQGKVAARSVIVAGNVIGDLLAAERIELGPTCKVEGNITAPRILIQDGATFDGQVFMKKPSGWDAGSDTQANITTSSARRAEPHKKSAPRGPDAQ